MKMTNEEILEVLNAFDEEKDLEFKNTDGNWNKSGSFKTDVILNIVNDNMVYRVKKEPVTETVELYTQFMGKEEMDVSSYHKDTCDTHKITYEVKDGVKQLDTFKIEEL